MDIFDKKHTGYFISTDPKKLDRDLIHRFLSKDSYWAAGASLEEVGETMDGSLCFGVYFDKQQVGFASVETDYSSFAYLTDIFILEDFRGQGLSQWLIDTIISHPGLQDLNSWMLITEDAQSLYERFGFKPIEGSPGQMVKLNPKFYNNG